MTVRPVRGSDLEAVAALVCEIDSTAVMTPALLAAEFAAFPGDRFVAEVDGQIVGWAPAFHRADGAVSFWIGVLPAFRRRGLGAALYSALAAQLDGVRSRGYADGDEGSRFLETRGYAPAGKLHLGTLDLAAAVLPDARVSGFDAVPLAELLDRLPDVHRLYSAVRADIPREHQIAPVPYSEFEAEIEGGLFDPAASVVVLEGNEPVALSFSMTDCETGRADTDLTGTLAAYRGRGLARFAKADSLRRLRALGIHTVATANDDTNEPMRALNESLGFRPAATWTRYVR
ncbi:MAG: N-acetyltransferase family protein [Gaiellaceae bacterium]